MSLRERVHRIEERLTGLEEKLAKMEEQMAGIQDLTVTPDDKVDLQKIFSQIDETAEKAAKHRSYLVHTDPPAS